MEHIDSLDTSLIVRFITNDIPAQRNRVKKLLAAPSTTHILFDTALIETVFVLEMVYHFSRTEIVDHLNLFLAHYCDVIEYNRPLTRAVFPFYLEHPKLSFTDCCLATLAELNDAEPLFTLDKKLANQHPAVKLV